jgi:hypothetical protein
MVSSLTWIDHDAAARERSLRILSLFKTTTRDELGLGAIRDSFADRLFPGTSTIQTRLRYMLFVPWIYRDLEERGVSVERFARKADAAERDLIDALCSADEREHGILGAQAGRDLKRLPSSVYWAGLVSWEIFRTDLSQDQYHRQIGTIYDKRVEQSWRDKERARRGDDDERVPARGTVTWHPQLPACPSDFPGDVDFRLTAEEAGFLVDRIQKRHPGSLLGHLSLHPEPADVAFAWHHPNWSSFPPEHKELLEHAELFSEVMHGAALAYNIELSKLGNRDAKLQAYEKAAADWGSNLDLAKISRWDLDRLWALTLNQGHVIKKAARAFVANWVGLVVDTRGKIADNTAVRSLVRLRESEVKPPGRQRFNNRRALDEWKGASGLGRMDYRWDTARTFLEDLRDGLDGNTA